MYWPRPPHTARRTAAPWTGPLGRDTVPRPYATPSDVSAHRAKAPMGGVQRTSASSRQRCAQVTCLGSRNAEQDATRDGWAAPGLTRNSALTVRCFNGHRNPLVTTRGASPVRRPIAHRMRTPGTMTRSGPNTTRTTPAASSVTAFTPFGRYLWQEAGHPGYVPGKHGECGNRSGTRPRLHWVAASAAGVSAPQYTGNIGWSGRGRPVTLVIQSASSPAT